MTKQKMINNSSLQQESTKMLEPLIEYIKNKTRQKINRRTIKHCIKTKKNRENIFYMTMFMVVTTQTHAP